jgi:hypothetical protein
MCRVSELPLSVWSLHKHPLQFTTRADTKGIKMLTVLGLELILGLGDFFV